MFCDLFPLFAVGGIIPGELSGKTQSKVIKIDLEKWRVSKELAKDKNVLKSYMKTCLTHAFAQGRC